MTRVDLENALKASYGNVSAAAKMLNLSRRAFYYAADRLCVQVAAHRDVTLEVKLPRAADQELSQLSTMLELPADSVVAEAVHQLYLTLNLHPELARKEGRT